jgi:tetratricopeptide (TPR) repeat protein
MHLIVLLVIILTTVSEAYAIAPLKLDNPPALREIAFKHYLENKADLSLDFYQKAIEKSTKEYGDGATYTGELYLEASTVALGMSKFSLAENYLNKAVSINPNSVTARLKLAELLKLRQKPEAAHSQIEQALVHNGKSNEARGQLVAWLQKNNPAQASRQAFLIDRVNNGLPPASSQSTSKPETLAHITPISPKPVNLIQAGKKDSNKKTADAKHQKNKDKAEKAKGKVASKTDSMTKESTKPVKKARTKQSPGSRKGKSNGTFGLIPPPPPLIPGIPMMAPELNSTSAPEPSTTPETKAHKQKDKAVKDKQSKNKHKDEKSGKTEAASESSSEKESKIAPPGKSNAEAEPDFLIDWGGAKKKK